MSRASNHKLIGRSARFDWVVSGAARGPLPQFDEPLLQDDSAVAIPSLGSLVPGWTLLVPRQTAPNFRDAGAATRARMSTVRGTAVATLAKQWSDPIFEFEHGADAYGSLTGCGVDQAHLHLVPLPFDLVEAASNLARDGFHFGGVNDPWALAPKRGDYLLVRNVATDLGVFLKPKVPESQALRKLIAKRLGRPLDWNYRLHAGAENVAATRNAFRGVHQGG